MGVQCVDCLETTVQQSLYSNCTAITNDALAGLGSTSAPGGSSSRPPRHQDPPGAANPGTRLKSLRHAAAIGGVPPQRLT